MDVVYCKNRTTPLPIGAVKSNMGHSEPASLLCSIIKALLIFENKKIPPNIHFTEPRSDCPALIEGRLKVIDEVTAFDGTHIACNSFGFGGMRSLNFKVCIEISQKLIHRWKRSCFVESNYW